MQPALHVVQSKPSAMYEVNDIPANRCIAHLFSVFQHTQRSRTSCALKQVLPMAFLVDARSFCQHLLHREGIQWRTGGGASPCSKERRSSHLMTSPGVFIRPLLPAYEQTNRCGKGSSLAFYETGSSLAIYETGSSLFCLLKREPYHLCH